MTAILLVRLSAMGDVVMASSLLSRFRRRYPTARIVWLAQPEVAPLLQHHPALDAVVVWPRQQWLQLWQRRHYRQLWREVLALRQRLRNEHFDLAIDLQGLLKSGLLLWLSGAKRRIGLGSREGSGRLMSEVIQRIPDDPGFGSEYRQLARHLGATDTNFFPELILLDADRESIRAQLATVDAASGYVVFAPFTTRPQKHWLIDRWIALGEQLQQRYALRCVVLGGPTDQDQGQALATAIGASAINLAGATTLREAAAAIASARLLIGVDTGLTHMALGFSTPSIALFGATRPYLESGSEEAVICYHQHTCSPCRRRPSCDGRFDCMADISVAEVLKNVESLL